MSVQTTSDITADSTTPYPRLCLMTEPEKTVTTPLRASDSADCPQILLDRSHRVRAANHAFRELFHVAPGISHGAHLFETRNSPWNQPVIHALLSEAWN